MTVLVELMFFTSLGATYQFPDVDPREAERLVEGLPRYAQLTLTNASGACLVLPMRIVDVVYVAGMERWRRAP